MLPSRLSSPSNLRSPRGRLCTRFSPCAAPFHCTVATIYFPLFSLHLSFAFPLYLSIVLLSTEQSSHCVQPCADGEAHEEESVLEEIVLER